MSIRIFLFAATASCAVACGSSTPEPKQPMADAEAATRAAREVGAESEPGARLRAKLADEAIAQAKAAVARGDNDRATMLAIRAKADADLALALAREQTANVEKQKAVEASSARTKTTQGAKP